MPIEFLKRDRDFAKYDPRKPQYVYKTVRRKGKKFQVGDEVIELFNIGVLAEAMDRKVITLNEWQRKGWLPKPLFDVKLFHKGRRWYSGVQILNLHHLMMSKYQGKKYLHDVDLHRRFLEDVRAVFYQRTLVVDQQGNINLPENEAELWREKQNEHQRNYRERVRRERVRISDEPGGEQKRGVPPHHRYHRGRRKDPAHGGAGEAHAGRPLRSDGE